MFFLSGVARFLFVPLAEAVVFAMLASYLLSRTLVPTLVMLLMGGHARRPRPERQAQPAAAHLPQLRPPLRARARAPTRWCCRRSCRRRGRFIALFLGFCVLSCLLFPVLGRDFFPSVDAGQIRLHMRAPTGTRIEETARLADEVEAAIRELIPKDELETILDNLGVPNSGINLSYSNAGTIGTLDGEILMSLRERPPADRGTRVAAARRTAQRFPGVEFFFQPADIVTQILNFGLPAADRRAVRRQRPAGNAARAAELVKAIRQIPGAVDVHVHQRLRRPRRSTCRWTARRLQQFGPVGARTSAQNVLIALSGSSQTAAGLLAQPGERRGLQRGGADAAVQGRLARRAAQHRRSARRRRAGATAPQLLGNLVEASPAAQPAVVSRYNIAAGDRRLRQRARHRPGAAWRRRCETLVDEMRPKLSRGSQVTLRGQVQTMQSSFIGLGVGLAMAIVLVYLLIVVTFQSWLDAVIIITALPARAGRHRLDAVPHRHHAERAGADRRHHDHGRGHRQQHPAGVLRARAPGRGRAAAVGRARSRRHPHPAGADDGAGDDHRHDPDGAGPGRRRRAERAAGPRRDRRPAVRDRLDPVLRAGRLCRDPQPPGPSPRAPRGPLRRARAARRPPETDHPIRNAMRPWASTPSRPTMRTAPAARLPRRRQIVRGARARLRVCSPSARAHRVRPPTPTHANAGAAADRAPAT